MDLRQQASRTNDRQEDDGAIEVDRTHAVDDGEALQFEWGSIQWLCSGQLFADAQQTVGYVQIMPGQKNPLHHHPNSDEILFLLDGELYHSLGQATYHLTPGMAIHIPQGVDHDARNPTDRVARMLVAYPTSDRRVVMGEEGEE